MEELKDAINLATKAINNTDTVNKRLILMFIICISVVSLSFASVIIYRDYQMYDYEYTNTNVNENYNYNENGESYENETDTAN